MRIAPRTVIFAAFGVGPLLLAAGCGGSPASGSRVTIANIQPTSFVEIPPATTTTTTTIPTADGGGGVSPNEQTYTVKSGDSISKIAGLYGITMEQLVNYNSWTEGTSHDLFAGDVVKIPPQASIPGGDSGNSGNSGDTGDTGDSGDGTETGSADEPASGDGCPTTYVIKSGDTSRINVAKQFGITFQEMDAANVEAGTPGYSSFVVGTEIIIPCPS